MTQSFYEARKRDLPIVQNCVSKTDTFLGTCVFFLLEACFLQYFEDIKTDLSSCSEFNFKSRHQTWDASLLLGLFFLALFLTPFTGYSRGKSSSNICPGPSLSPRLGFSALADFSLRFPSEPECFSSISISSSLSSSFSLLFFDFFSDFFSDFFFLLFFSDFLLFFFLLFSFLRSALSLAAFFV